MKMVVAGKLNVDLCAAARRRRRAARRPARRDAPTVRATAPAEVYAGAGPEPIDFGLSAT